MTKRVILVQHRQCILGNCVLHPSLLKLQKLLYLMSIVFYLSTVLWFYLLLSIYSSIGHSVYRSTYPFIILSVISSITHIQLLEWILMNT